MRQFRTLVACWLVTGVLAGTSAANADGLAPIDEAVAEGPEAESASRVVGRFDAAFSGVEGLAVWAETRNGHSDVYASRIGTSGYSGGWPAILVAGGPGDQTLPSVAWVGDTYFVVWQHQRADGTFDVRGARVDYYGQVLDPTGVTVAAAATLNETSPDIATPFTGALVVFERSAGAGREVWGRRIAADGVPLAGAFAIGAGTGVRSNPSVGAGPTGYLVAWAIRRAGGASDIVGSRVTTAGVVRDPNGIAVATGPKEQVNPAVGGESRRFTVAWEQIEGTHSDIRVGAVLPDASVPFNVGVALGPAEQGNPSVVGGSDATRIAWEHDGAGRTQVRSALLTGRTVAASAGVIDGTVDRVLPELAGDPSGALVLWLDRRTGSNEVYATVWTPSGPENPAGHIVTAPRPIESQMTVDADRRGFIVQFASDVRPATFSAADLTITSADAGETIGKVTRLDNQQFHVEVVGSPLDGGDEVSIVDGVPADGLAEIRGADGFRKVTPSSATAVAPSNFGVQISGEAGATSAFAVFSSDVVPGTVGVADFGVQSLGRPKSVTAVSMVPGTSDTTVSISLDGALEPGDEISLLDGTPADGLAEIESPSGGRALLTSRVVVGGAPMTATIDARHGASEFFVTFSDTVSSPIGAWAFATSGPTPQFASVVPDTNGRTFRVWWSSGVLMPGDVVRLVDGNPPDGRAEVFDVAGHKTLPTSVTVMPDEIAPTATLTAGQGGYYVVEFSEPVTPMPRDRNIPGLFLLGRGTGSSTPAYSPGSPPAETCRQLTCVIGYGFGTPLVPGNTITIPSGAFSDLAGNPIAQTVAHVVLDDTRPLITAARVVDAGSFLEVTFSEYVTEYSPNGGLAIDSDGDLSTTSDRTAVWGVSLTRRVRRGLTGVQVEPGLSKLIVVDRIADLSENDLELSTVVTITG